jgi:murein DD-endopeptidase MepM/ murein hydrolase activator NlpD
MKGNGKTVQIDDGAGTTTLYGHNSENAVSTGDAVARGDVIGSVGQTGNASGEPASESHVHFEVHEDGQRVNPAAWLDSAVTPP